MTQKHRAQESAELPGFSQSLYKRDSSIRAVTCYWASCHPHRQLEGGGGEVWTTHPGPWTPKLYCSCRTTSPSSMLDPQNRKGHGKATRISSPLPPSTKEALRSVSSLWSLHPYGWSPWECNYVSNSSLFSKGHWERVKYVAGQIHWSPVGSST